MLSRATRPLLAFHDYNLPGVATAISLFQRLGVLYNCRILGETLSHEEALVEWDNNPDRDFPMTRQIQGPFHEGLICKVHLETALHPLAQALQDPEGALWLIYESTQLVQPIGTLRFYWGISEDHRSMAPGGTVLFTLFSDTEKAWHAKWKLDGSQIVVAIDTVFGTQYGVLSFGRWRTSLLLQMPVADCPGIRENLSACGGSYVDRPIYHGDGASHPISIWRGPYPGGQMIGLLHRKILGEVTALFKDMQGGYAPAHDVAV